MKHKQHQGATVEVKAEGDKGEVIAVFSTFNVIDHDGDVTMPDAFEKGAEVRISAYNHTSWQGALPVGKGRIDFDSKQAWVDGAFFLNTDHGRNTFETVKGLGSLGEWSYGFDVVQGKSGDWEGKPAYILEKLKVHETSPVLLGAGIGTHTVSAKSLDFAKLGDDECREQAVKVCESLLSRGIALPEELVKAVRDADAEAEEIKRRNEMLRVIAGVHGIDTEGDHE